jgi:hypothetical protein
MVDGGVEGRDLDPLVAEQLPDGPEVRPTKWLERLGEGKLLERHTRAFNHLEGLEGYQK